MIIVVKSNEVRPGCESTWLGRSNSRWTGITDMQSETPSSFLPVATHVPRVGKLTRSGYTKKALRMTRFRLEETDSISNRSFLALGNIAIPEQLSQLPAGGWAPQASKDGSARRLFCSLGHYAHCVP